MKLKTKRLVKNAVLMLLILLLLFGTVGCKKQPSKAEQAVAYMNAKYDDEFTFKHYFGSIVFLQSKRFPDTAVRVTGDKLADGTYEFWDNYVYCKYEKETRDFFQTFFEDIFQCEIKVSYSQEDSTFVWETDSDAQTIFNEFIHSPVNVFQVRVIVSNERKLTDKEIEENLKECIIEEGIRFNSLSCYFVDVQEDFTKGFELEDNYLKEQKRLWIRMDNKTEFSTFKWRNVE